MGFLNKLKTAFGNSESQKTSVEGNYVEEIINSIKNTPFAVSETNVLYAGINELASYTYVQTVIVGTLKLKTHKGATLKITGNDFYLHLNSDMLELESEATYKSNQYITKIDFEIDKENLPKLQTKTIESLELSTKKIGIDFKVLESAELMLSHTDAEE